MRLFYFPLLAVAALAAAQSAPPALLAPPNLSIPVELSKTIHAEKAHYGDVVEFRTLEPVLVEKGIIIPADARVSGRVLGAAPRNGEKPSWMVILAERVEWKEHSLLLHAFVSSQIAVQAAKEVVNAADNEPPSDLDRRTQRDGNTRGYRSIADLSDMVDPHHKSEWASHDDDQPNRTVVPALQDVRIFHDKSGNTFLLTQGHNLKLPAGLRLMLLNQTAAAAH